MSNRTAQADQRGLLLPRRPPWLYNGVMGATPALVSPQEYLDTSFPDGDHEYVDGQLVERTMGEKDHSTAQRRIILFFARFEQSHRLIAFPEQRVRVTAERYRIPDVLICHGEEPDEQVFTSPPLLVIEIISRTDSIIDLNQKIADYRAFGVPHIWVIDPQNRGAMHYTLDGAQEVRDGILRLPEAGVEMPLEEVLPKRN